MFDSAAVLNNYLNERVFRPEEMVFVFENGVLIPYFVRGIRGIRENKSLMLEKYLPEKRISHLIDWRNALQDGTHHYVSDRISLAVSGEIISEIYPNNPFLLKKEDIRKLKFASITRDDVTVIAWIAPIISNFDSAAWVSAWINVPDGLVDSVPDFFEKL